MTEHSADDGDVSGDEVDLDALEASFAADKITTRRKATERSVTYANEEPSRAPDIVDLLVDQLDDDALVVSHGAGEAISEIASDTPEAATAAADPLVDALEDDAAMNQFYVAAAIRPIAAYDPTVFADRIEDMLAILEQPIDEPVEHTEARSVSDEFKESLDNMSRSETQSKMAAHGIVANVVAAIAEVEPAALADYVDELAALIDTDVELVVVTVLDTLATLAEHDPELVSDVVDDIVAALDHHDEGVRAQAITALGFIGDPDTADVVRGVAKTDSNEDVRALAEQTVSFLE